MDTTKTDNTKFTNNAEKYKMMYAEHNQKRQKKNNMDKKSDEFFVIIGRIKWVK